MAANHSVLIACSGYDNSVTLPPPRLGHVSICTLVAVGSGSVVFTLALEQIRVVLGGRAHVGVSVAHAPSTHTDLLYSIVVLRQKRWDIVEWWVLQLSVQNYSWNYYPSCHSSVALSN